MIKSHPDGPQEKPLLKKKNMIGVDMSNLLH